MTIPSSIEPLMEWLTVLGYVAFAAFITWKVVTTKRPD